MSVSCATASPNAIVSNIKTAAAKGSPVPTRPQLSRGRVPIVTANGLMRHSEQYRIFSASDSEIAGLDAGMVLDPIYCDLEDSSAHARAVPDCCVFGIAAASRIFSKQERVVVLSDVPDR